MWLINSMDNTEIPLPAFDKANKKYKGCKHCKEFMGQKTCILYNHKLETNMDVLAYCGNCPANTKEPTNKTIKVRSS